MGCCFSGISLQGHRGSAKRKGYLFLNAGDVKDVDSYGRLASSKREVVSGHPADLQRRRSILEETLRELGTPNRRRVYHILAQQKIQRWKGQSAEAETHLLAANVQLHKGDWGAVTL